MDHTTESLEATYIIGVSAPTSNIDGKAADVIGALWKQFYSENVANKLFGRVNDDVYCVYSNYNEQQPNEYLTIIGCRVESVEDVPYGMTSVLIPEGTYAKFVSEGNPESVLKTWEWVWEAGFPRSYTSDFDLYKNAVTEPSVSEVQTFVAISSDVSDE